MKRNDQSKVRFLRLQVGLLIGISFILFAFEYQSTYTEYTVFDTEEYKTQEIVYDINDVIRSVEEQEPEPVAEVVQQFQNLDWRNIETIDDDSLDYMDVSLDPDELIDQNGTEGGTGDGMGDGPDVDPVYDSYDLKNPAEFPGGQAALGDYIKGKVRPTRRMQVLGLKGTVYVLFVVDKSGQVRDVEILRGIEPGIDAQCKRAVENMPKWKPAERMGIKVSMRYRLPIKF